MKPPATILGLPVVVTGKPRPRKRRKRDVLREYKARQAKAPRWFGPY